MKLTYDQTGIEVKINDTVYLEENGEQVAHLITHIEKPRHGGSTGRVYVKAPSEKYSHSYFPSVIDATWIEREDQIDDEHVGELTHSASYGAMALAQQTGRSVVLEDGFGSFVVEL